MPVINPASFRLLVCGARNYWNVHKLTQVLCDLHEKRPISQLAEGEARGADTLAREWAELRNVQVIKFPADWDRYGKSAGPHRNEQMLREFQPHGAVAFFGKKYTGSGTTHMVGLLKKAGVPVAEIYE